MRHRRTGLLQRPTAWRDARLYLVASEDTYACDQYFRALHANGVIDARRVSVRVLPTPEGDGRSSPAAVLARMSSFDIDLRPMDERWLSLDRDRWTEGHLAEVGREAGQRGYELAVSNPCFEAWLLLHLSDAPLPETAAGCAAALRSQLGGYNKARLPGEPWSADAVAAATSRARALDIPPSDRWPRAPGSHLYRLVERLAPAVLAPPPG